jgi:hypothetical protein
MSPPVQSIGGRDTFLSREALGSLDSNSRNVPWRFGSHYGVYRVRKPSDYRRRGPLSFDDVDGWDLRPLDLD